MHRLIKTYVTRLLGTAALLALPPLAGADTGITPEQSGCSEVGNELDFHGRSLRKAGHLDR